MIPTRSLVTAWRQVVASAFILVASSLTVLKGMGQEPTVDFNRDVQPILSDRCYQCHGPDPSQRKAKLRLDIREDAFADRGGLPPLVAGKPDESEVIRRVEAEPGDPDRMPPNDAGKPLSPREIETLRRWVEQGATWRSHWAFTPPTRPAVPIAPDATNRSWTRNPIDAFVLARLRSENLEPSPEAPRSTLIRRLSFDLTGLPPALSAVEAYEANPSPEAYETVVDRLLASPHFGERMAMDWLDAARYADTDGFQSDATRSNWPWRDWVVDAFNANLPFDRFTLEQFAGDLLPNPTPEQILATSFHRQHMTNGEGGRDPEESRIDYVLDRINTMGTVWLGLTLGCTQCHSHKFDPISQAEYYQLNAFFNSIDEDGKAGRAAKPFTSYRSEAARRAVADARSRRDALTAADAQARRTAEPAFGLWLERQCQVVRNGHRSWTTFLPTELKSVAGTILTLGDEGVVSASGPDPRHEDYRLIGRVTLPRLTGLRLDVLPDPNRPSGGLSRSKSGHFLLTDIAIQVRQRDGTQIRELPVAGAVADVEADPAKNSGYGKVIHTLDDDPRNGWATFGHPTDRPHSAVYALAEPQVLGPNEELIVELRHRSTEGRLNIGRLRIGLTDQPGPAVESVEPTPLERLATAGVSDATEVPPALRASLFEQFLADHAPYQPSKAALRRAESWLAEIAEFEKSVEVMVLADRPEPRPTHVLIRGVWDKKGEVVGLDVPAALNPWPEGQPRDRLGLARWLVARDNPLTARVTVNRLWQNVFGAGLVRTPEDFGRQGEPPTHPELLDWLAVEFMESGWDVKHMIRLMVTSATYRQSSKLVPALIAHDPDNRLLARSTRQRLPSAMIRDAALTASSLLNPTLGGPPVRPYQPAGVWEEMFMGRFHYVPSDGPDQYRRTLYAFWRRSSAPAFLFDAAQRRVCEVRTSRTNTPLQALTLLNDQTYLESARTLAARALRETSSDVELVDALTRRVLSRTPSDTERSILTRELRRAREIYRAQPNAAARWLAHGQSPRDPSIDPVEHAACAVVADLILNLDEAITRE
ncbi:MAG: PSD1 and planctomycete cytochrome C domain-containing protein [Isosphaeraceae bacterium]